MITHPVPALRQAGGRTAVRRAMRPIDLSLGHLSGLYRSGELTLSLVLDYVSTKIEELRDYNIWITQVPRDQLETYAGALGQTDPAALPLYGIPFAIKDNIDLAGVPTTAGCEAYKYWPAQSATVVERLLSLGAIPIGKTNLDQFATGLVGVRSPYGVCANSFDKRYIAGGSSAGSALAVALGLASFALGTDTAGSGRIPAAFNNLIGVKPTRGLLSNAGVVPACQSLDCVSLFTLNTADAGLLLDKLAAYDEKDSYSRNAGRPPKRYRARFRFGVFADDRLDFFGHEGYRGLYHKAVKRLQQIGGEPITLDASPFLRAAQLLYQGPWIAERYGVAEELFTQKPQALLAITASILGAARNYTAVDAFRAQHELQALKRTSDRLLADVDFIVTPTAGTIYTIDEVAAQPVACNVNLGYYTNFMNLLDYAALALPAGFTEAALPGGITIFAEAFSDRQLLAYGARYMQSLDPPMGATQFHFHSDTGVASPHDEDPIALAVCGAHLSGMPLNHQLVDRGAVLAQTTTTAKRYRLYSLAGGPPKRPGLIRDAEQGEAIEVEVWHLPAAQLGSFVANVPPPLGIGKVELQDGSWVSGFICEGYAIAEATDITEYRGWRRFMASGIPD